MVVVTSETVQVQKEEKKVEIRQSVESIDVKSEVATEITQFIHSNTNTQLSSSTIQSINST